MQVKKMTHMAMYASLAVVLSIFESFIPFFDGYTILGMKLGLANIVILYVLYTYSFKEAFCIALLKVFIVALCRTGLFSFSFYFSLLGSVFSVSAMGFVKRINIFSILGVSIVGSFTHCLGQLFIAYFLLDIHLLSYLPFVLLLSVPTGILTGSMSKKLLMIQK